MKRETLSVKMTRGAAENALVLLRDAECRANANARTLPEDVHCAVAALEDALGYGIDVTMARPKP